MTIGEVYTDPGWIRIQRYQMLQKPDALVTRRVAADLLEMGARRPRSGPVDSATGLTFAKRF